jgi:hypothetical protein
MLAINDLMQNIFEGRSDFLTQWLAQQVTESRRFRIFSEQYRGKIRSKYRLSQNDDELRDLQLELDTARRLVSDKRFELEYEALSAQRKRNPDFTAHFRVNTHCTIEVTRIRLLRPDTPFYGLAAENAVALKLLFRLLEKCHQMQPATPNVLLIDAAPEGTLDDLLKATNTLKFLAERKEEALFIQRGGYQNAVDFLHHYFRVSALILRGTAPQFWQNPQAKHKLTPELASALKACFDIPR